MSSPIRACNIRMTGLFKKANTLHRMCGPKVAVLVEVDHNIYSYVSHADWAPIHQFLRTMGIHQENLKGPDQFDTVADRNGTRNSVSFGGSGESQVSPSSLLTTPLRQSVDGGRTEDHSIDELVSSLTRNPMSSQLTPSYPPTTESSRYITPDVLHGKEQGGREIAGDVGPRTAIDWPGSTNTEEQQTTRRPQFRGEQGSRKRKRTCTGEERRRKMVTRSQDVRQQF